jgi:hypothetical protein
MHDESLRRAQSVVFGLAIMVMPISVFVAGASIATSRLIFKTIYRLPDEMYPRVSAFFAHIGWVGFATIGVGSILVLAILRYKFHGAAALAVSCAVFAFVFCFCMAAVLASLLPHPWLCGSTGM